MPEEIIGALIAPILTALMAATTVGVRSVLSRRDQTHRRERALAAATQQVAFVNAWLDAYAKTSDSRGLDAHRARAAHDLESSYQVMMATVAAEAHAVPRLTIGDAARSLFLVGLKRPAARVVRTVYFVTSAITLLVLVALAAMSPGLWAENGVGVTIAATMIFSLFCATPSVVLWVWARALERRRPAVQPEPEPQMQSAAHSSSTRHEASPANRFVAPPSIRSRSSGAALT